MANVPSQDEMRRAIQALALRRESDERWVKRIITRKNVKRLTAHIRGALDRALNIVRA